MQVYVCRVCGTESDSAVCPICGAMNAEVGSGAQQDRKEMMARPPAPKNQPALLRDASPVFDPSAPAASPEEIRRASQPQQKPTQNASAEKAADPLHRNAFTRPRKPVVNPQAAQGIYRPEQVQNRPTQQIYQQPAYQQPAAQQRAVQQPIYQQQPAQHQQPAYQQGQQNARQQNVRQQNARQQPVMRQEAAESARERKRPAVMPETERTADVRQEENFRPQRSQQEAFGVKAGEERRQPERKPTGGSPSEKKKPKPRPIPPEEIKPEAAETTETARREERAEPEREYVEKAAIAEAAVETVRREEKAEPEQKSTEPDWDAISTESEEMPEAAGETEDAFDEYWFAESVPGRKQPEKIGFEWLQSVKKRMRTIKSRFEEIRRAGGSSEKKRAEKRDFGDAFEAEDTEKTAEFSAEDNPEDKEAAITAVLLAEDKPEKKEAVIAESHSEKDRPEDVDAEKAEELSEDNKSESEEAEKAEILPKENEPESEEAEKAEMPSEEDKPEGKDAAEAEKLSKEDEPESGEAEKASEDGEEEKKPESEADEEALSVAAAGDDDGEFFSFDSEDDTDEPEDITEKAAKAADSSGKTGLRGDVKRAGELISALTGGSLPGAAELMLNDSGGYGFCLLIPAQLAAIVLAGLCGRKLGGETGVFSGVSSSIGAAAIAWLEHTVILSILMAMALISAKKPKKTARVIATAMTALLPLCASTAPALAAAYFFPVLTVPFLAVGAGWSLILVYSVLDKAGISGKKLGALRTAAFMLVYILAIGFLAGQFI